MAITRSAQLHSVDWFVDVEHSAGGVEAALYVKILQSFTRIKYPRFVAQFGQQWLPPIQGDDKVGGHRAARRNCLHL